MASPEIASFIKHSRYLTLELSRKFQRTDMLVSRIFQRIDLCDGAHVLKFLCGSRKLIEIIRTVRLCYNMIMSFC